MLPDPEYISECFSYDAQTGALQWKERPLGHFKSKHAYAIQRARAGKSAGCFDASTGYLVIGLNGKLYYAHRLIWALVSGAWPKGEIDHISGDKTDNRWANLRAVTHAENNRNTPLRTNNGSGTMGVSYAKREGKWRARIMHEGHDYHCGYFGSREEAVQARSAAAERFGFHENHGRAA